MSDGPTSAPVKTLRFEQETRLAVSLGITVLRFRYAVLRALVQQPSSKVYLPPLTFLKRASSYVMSDGFGVTDLSI